jgi:hypothetical protein
LCAAASPCPHAQKASRKKQALAAGSAPFAATNQGSVQILSKIGVKSDIERAYTPLAEPHINTINPAASTSQPPSKRGS